MTVLFQGLAALAVVIISGWQCLTMPTPVPSGDSPRYMRPALNLAVHGIISNKPFDPDRTPSPSLVNGGPLIVFEIAPLLALDHGLKQTFICVLTSPSREGCKLELASVKFVHWLEFLIFFLCLGGTARLVTGSTFAAWSAVFVALLCKEMFEFSGLVLTEPVYLACVGASLYFWTRAILVPQSGRLMWLGAGFMAGLAILAKPAAMMLLPSAAVTLVLAVSLGKLTTRRATLLGLTFYLFCAVTLAPWLYRNERTLGRLALAAPVHLEAALSHRVAYNAMSWSEFGVAWVYYLPDFGAKLAEELFGRAKTKKLGLGQGSYYEFGRDVLYPSVRQRPHPPAAISILLREHVLGDFVKHIAVSIVFLWRGIFVSSYWGLGGLMVMLAFFALSGRSWEMLVVALPTFAIAALNATVSVSITRYNLQLIVPYAVSLGWLVQICANRFLRRSISPGSPKAIVLDSR